LGNVYSRFWQIMISIAGLSFNMETRSNSNGYINIPAKKPTHSLCRTGVIIFSQTRSFNSRLRVSVGAAISTDMGMRETTSNPELCMAEVTKDSERPFQ
jgi:hypothetical protein